MKLVGIAALLAPIAFTSGLYLPSPTASNRPEQNPPPVVVDTSSTSSNEKAAIVINEAPSIEELRKIMIPEKAAGFQRSIILQYPNSDAATSSKKPNAAETTNNNPSSTNSDPHPNDHLITITLTGQHADELMQILRDRSMSGEEHASTRNASSVSRSIIPQDIALPIEQSRAEGNSGPTPTSASLAHDKSIVSATAPNEAQARLASAMPLIFAFIGSTSLIVILLIYVGVNLIRANTASGSAKIEFFGMRIDAKGGGIVSITCGTFVLLATFRPLIDAVITLSQK